ncbi:DUF4255 domain-containing protein [Polaribacter sp.]|uniref:DUF4255 domain-containing protein n=1 Tax=Polaribacter sp. TaxID=1920175 RepID=UPI003EF6934F
MIHATLKFLSDFLNRELKLGFNTDVNKVVIGNLINLDGSINVDVKNKVVITLLNINSETIQLTKKKMGNTFEKTSPPLFLNISILITANYESKNYSEGLKTISKTISTFHSNSIFNKKMYPSLDEHLVRLNIETENLDVKEHSKIVSEIGAKQCPSVIYKVRILPTEPEVHTPIITVPHI